MERCLPYRIQHFKKQEQKLVKIPAILVKPFSPRSTPSLHFGFSSFAMGLLRMRGDLGYIEQVLFPINPEGWRWCSRNEKLKLSHDDSAPGAGAFLYIKYNKIGIEIQRSGRSEEATTKQGTGEMPWSPHAPVLSWQMCFLKKYQEMNIYKKRAPHF